MKGKLYLAVGSSVALVLAGGLVSGGVVHAACDVEHGQYDYRGDDAEF